MKAGSSTFLTTSFPHLYKDDGICKAIEFRDILDAGSISGETLLTAINSSFTFLHPLQGTFNISAGKTQCTVIKFRIFSTYEVIEDQIVGGHPNCRISGRKRYF